MAGRASDSETQALIRCLARENPDWGAPRIHEELLKLGLTLSERSVARLSAWPRAAGRFPAALIRSRARDFLFARGSTPIKDFRESWSLACIRAGVPGLLFRDLH